jgi:hypothetical protein
MPSNTFTNLQVVPLYTSAEFANYSKWWINNPWATPVPLGRFLPVQWKMPKGQSITAIKLVNFETGVKVDVFSVFNNGGSSVIAGGAADEDTFVYPAVLPTGLTAEPGTYFFEVLSGSDTFSSDIFIWVEDPTRLIKIEYWHNEPIETVVGNLYYNYPYKSVMYLVGEIAKPKYGYEETVLPRESVDLPVQQISFKRHVFAVPLPEHLIDAARAIRLHDEVRITWRGREYDVDSFLMEDPSWEAHGDLAEVVFEFRTDTTVTVNARGHGGSFYGVEPGGCISTSYRAIAEVVTGSTEWTSSSYEKDGVNVPFAVGDYIVSVNGSDRLLVEFTGNGYAPVTLTDNQVVYSTRENSYYFYHAANQVLSAPVITNYNSGSQVVTGRTIMGSSVYVMAGGGGNPEREVGYGTSQELLTGGISVSTNSNDTFLYLRAVTLNCPDFVARGSNFTITAPAGPIGVGHDRVGSTLKVY